MPTAAALLGVVGRDRDVARSLIGGNDWCRSSTRPPDSQEGAIMPKVEVNGLTVNYEVQGEGEPLLLIPYTSADHACYAFQLPAYTEHFSCIAIDLPGSGESDKPAGRTRPTATPTRLPPSWAPSGSSGRTWRACHSARRWASTWPPAIPAACARSPCTAAGTPAMTI